MLSLTCWVLSVPGKPSKRRGKGLTGGCPLADRGPLTFTPFPRLLPPIWPSVLSMVQRFYLWGSLGGDCTVSEQASPRPHLGPMKEHF